MRFINKICVFFVCFLILISVSAISATDNFDNQTLDNTKEEVITNTEVKTFDDLQTQINQKNDGENLVLTENYDCSEEINSTIHYKELKINKSITITGVNDNEITQAKINITSSDLVIKNLIFNSCDIFVSNANLTLMNCNIQNYVNYDYSIHGGDNLKIINSTFFKTDNPIGYAKNVTIINSTFDQKNCHNYYFNYIESIKIFNSEFKNLTDFVISSDEAEISNSIFKQNINMGLNFKNVNMTNCEFINNVDTYISTDEYMAHYNILGIYGNATLTNNTFLNNTYLTAISFTPEKNVVANFNLMNNLFISEYCNYEFNYDQTLHNLITLSSIDIKPSTKTIHVIPDDPDFDDYYYDKSISKIYLKNNYFGFNIEDSDEFNLNKLIVCKLIGSNDRYLKPKLVNLYLEKNNDKYALNFIDDTGNIVILPKSTFTIIDKDTNEVIVSNISIVNGTAIFDCDKEITQDNVYIINCLNQIVNKPKANITILKTGTDYLDTKVEVELKNGSVPIGNEIIGLIITEYYSFSRNSTFYTSEFTRLNGTAICVGESDGYYIINPRYSTHIEKYTIKALFSNKDFGTTTEDITVKFNKIDTMLTLKSSTKTYNPNAFKITSMSQLSPVTWTCAKYNKVNDGSLSYKIYKNNKLVFRTILHCYDGIIKSLEKSKFPALNVGTYKVVVDDSDHAGQIYNVPVKTTTLKIKPAKTNIKAPKVTNKFKKSQYFKIKIKLNGNAIKKIKINLKIFTGKKSKNYAIKTDKNGIAKFNTKNLKVGKHKVVITSKNGNYIINAKSQINIKR